MGLSEYIGGVFALKITFKDMDPFIDAIYSNYAAAHEEGERYLASSRSMGLSDDFVKYEIVTYDLRGQIQWRALVDLKNNG